MSEFSGKCDVADSYFMSKDGWDFSKVKIYADFEDVVPLRIDCEKDLVPYYPYIEAISAYSNGERTIFLSRRSYVDEEEEEWLSWRLRDCIKYWKKCKRNKIPFDVAECQEKVFGIWKHVDEQDKEIVERVAKFGDKATIEGIHDVCHDRFREELYKEMIRVGWNENQAYKWCYGFDRWIEKNKFLQEK